MNIIQIKCKRFIGKLCVCAIGLGITLPVGATTEQEHSVLARIIKELETLTPLIAEAEHYQVPHSRVPFHYDRLRHDIAAIKAGIQQKLEIDYHEPRVIETIDGDYLTRR